MEGSPCDNNRCDVRTVVLVGKTGHGKSATGNSLLGTKAFKSKTMSTGVASTCEMQMTVLEDGVILNVIDTPGMFDFKASTESIQKEIARCITMAKDGIHAVLLVLSVRFRFSQEEAAAIDNMCKFFGKTIFDYMIVVFTGGDGFEGSSETLDDYLGHECPEPLQEILKMCGNRRVLFDNKTEDLSTKNDQLTTLLKLVDDVVNRNGGKPFSDELILEVKKDVDSDQEVSNLHTRIDDSHDEQLKISQMVVLEESTLTLECRIAQEQAARFRAEADLLRTKLQAAQFRAEADLQLQAARFQAETDLLRRQLQRAQQQTDELRRQTHSGNCAIL